MSLNESIINIRVKLQNSKLKKSGLNKFANFDYFELADFLPRLNELMLEEKVNDIFTIEDDKAKLILIKNDERQEYDIPFIQYETPLNNKGQKSMQDIQYLGALNTYYKRYLYMNAFGITDGEVIDAMDNSDRAMPKLINDTQIQKLEQLIKETDEKNLKVIYKTYKINDLRQLTESQFKECVSGLNKSKNKLDMNAPKQEFYE